MASEVNRSKDRAKSQVPMVPPSVIEELVATGPDVELWWDSSPLVFDGWLDDLLAKTPEAARPALREQMLRLFNPADPAAGLFSGCTTNPPLSWQVIQKNPDYWRQWVRGFRRQHPAMSRYDVFWATYLAIVSAGAKAFYPMFIKSGYKRGFVSGQVDPRILTDTARMVQQGVALHQQSGNVMIKIPGTREGLAAIEELTARGIPTNATLTFAVSQLVAVPQAVERGLARARAAGIDLARWRSVATMFYGALEECPVFAEEARALGLDLTAEKKRLAGVAVCKKAYRLFKERGYPSKILAAALRPGPTINGREKFWHVEHLAGGDVAITCWPGSLELLLKGYDPGEFRSRIDEDVPAPLLAELRRMKHFREAYDEDGLRPEDWLTWPPTVSVAGRFAAATDEMESWIGEAMNS